MYNPTDRFQNWFITSLQTDINDTTNSFRLNKALNVQQGRLIINPYDEDNREVVKVTSVDGTLIYVERGDDNTTPQYQSEGTIVAMNVVAADLNDLYADWAAMEITLQTLADNGQAVVDAAGATQAAAIAATSAANDATADATAATSAANIAASDAASAAISANDAASDANTATTNANAATTSANTAATTANDAAADALAAAGHFVPAGGLTGQALVKVSGTDWDTEWANAGGVGIVPKETPTGAVNGSNAVFTTSQPYVAGSLMVYINGLAEGFFVTETNPATGSFTLDIAPSTGDNIFVSYQHSMSATGSADILDGYHANAAPTANTILPLDADGKYPLSVMPLHAIQLSIAANLAISSSSPFPFDTTQVTVGDKLTRSGGTVVIGAGVSVVRVYYNFMTENGGTNNYLYGRIRKNSTEVSQHIADENTVTFKSVGANTLVSVTAGDVISIALEANGGNVTVRANVSTFTVEVVA